MDIMLIGSRAAARCNHIFANQLHPHADWDFIISPESVPVFRNLLVTHFGEELLTRWEPQHDGRVIAIDIGPRPEDRRLNPGFTHIDLEIAAPGTSARTLLDQGWSKAVDIEMWNDAASLPLEFGVKLAGLESLALIKRSHAHVPLPKWKRHIMRYGLMRFALGEDFRFNERQRDILRQRIRETNDIHSAHFPRLKGMSKQEFFAGEELFFRTPLPPLFEHDDIHVTVSNMTGYDTPAYDLMTEGNEVECTRAGWEQMSREDKARAVIEESIVLAIERCMAPWHYCGQVRLFDNPTPDRAFDWALGRVCTTITSGWFRAWAIDNYFYVVNTYRRKYRDWWNLYLSTPTPEWYSPEWCREWIDNLELSEPKPGVRVYPAFVEA